MDRSCAWCGAPLRVAPNRDLPGDFLERCGICARCVRILRDDLDVSLDTFLSERGTPVFVLAHDAHVVDASPAAVDMLDEERDVLLGRLAGDVLGCESSELCRDERDEPPCSDCTLHRTVTETWSTGRPKVRIPATLTVTSHARPMKVSFLVSTAKVGDSVLLRIDPPGPGEATAR